MIDDDDDELRFAAFLCFIFSVPLIGQNKKSELVAFGSTNLQRAFFTA